jgi:hypothetical protein
MYGSAAFSPLSEVLTPRPLARCCSNGIERLLRRPVLAQLLLIEHTLDAPDLQLPIAQIPERHRHTIGYVVVLPMREVGQRPGA